MPGSVHIGLLSATRVTLPGSFTAPPPQLPQALSVAILMSVLNLRLKTATELFHGGRLAEAAALCEALAADREASSRFCGLFGELQVLRNQTDAAEPLLVAALAEAPESVRLRGLLAETYRRAGRLLEAAGLYRDLNRPALAAKLAATGGGWYRLTPPAAPVTLPWLGESGPALIEARVGDGQVGRFLIDTGVGETLLDPYLASAVGVTPFGDEAIHFPAGPARLDILFDHLPVIGWFKGIHCPFHNFF